METKKCGNVNLSGTLSQCSASEKYPRDKRHSVVCNGLGSEML